MEDIIDAMEHLSDKDVQMNFHVSAEDLDI
jgi:hypothetical protein